MFEFFELIGAETELLGARAKLATARFENAISRLGNAIRLWKVEGDYEGLQERLPTILRATEMGNLGAVHYICTPPPNSDLEERRFSSDFSILSRPELSPEELEQIRQADENFKDYLETLPAGSQISVTFTNRQNEILGTTTVSKK